MSAHRKALLLTLISMMLSMSLSSRYKGCVQLEPYVDPDLHYAPCRVCYRRMINTETLLCEDQVDETLHCETFLKDNATKKNRCGSCLPGYYLALDNGRSLAKCVAETNPDKLCVTGVLSKGKLYCGECRDGYLALPFPPKCIPVSQVKDAQPNCLYGSIQPRCALCKKGYSIKPPDGKCVPWRGKTDGCLYQDEMHHHCVVCNGAEGYSVNGRNGCIKNL